MKTLTIPQPRNPCPGFKPSSPEDRINARTPIKHALTDAQRNWIKSKK